MRVRTWLLAVLPCAVLAWSPPAAAQQRQISGTVTSAASGAPLVGAQVTIAGTTRGVQTGAGGNFTITVPAGDARLGVRLLGYRYREIPVPAGQSTVQVRLETDVLNLEAVVVTGQATSVARRNLANAVSTVQADEVQRAPAQSLDAALQGKIAGANIVANSGAPGGGIQVSLRGVSSINASAEPLWVVDGVIVSNVAIPSGSNAVTRASPGLNASNQDNPTNRIADLNPDDIASVEILKGASAAAIYGSKASNGVIIITTRRGRTGAPRISLSQQFGRYSLANTLGSRDFTRDEAVAAYGPGVGQYFGADGRPLQVYDHERQLAGQREMATHTGLSVSGGTEATRYYVSGAVENDPGIIHGTGFQKQALRVNLDQRLSGRVELALGASLSHTLAARGLTNNDNTNSSYYMALSATPSFVNLGRDSNGTFPSNPFTDSNPLQTAALTTNDESVYRMLGSATLRADLFSRDRHALRLIATGGADYFDQTNQLIFPPELQFQFNEPLKGASLRSNSDNLNLNLSGNLVHTFAARSWTATTSAGVQYEDRDLNISRIIARNLIAGQDNPDQATSISVFYNRQRVRDLGVYLQEELLLFDNRMLLTGSVRADQSSNNGDADRMYLFPKAAASYQLPFTPRYVDELKLRVAYGETGNQPLYGAKFVTLNATQNIGGNPGLGVFGGSTTRGSADIRPERQREIEGGFDATLLNGRAAVDFTYYHQTITDLLLSRTIPPSSGFTQEIFNGGELTTTGIEAGLTVTPIQRGNFNWTSRTTFYRTRSTITELPVPSFRPLGFGFGSSSLGQFFIEEGKSATQIIGPENGVLVALGDATPDFKMGFSNDFDIGPFRVTSLFDWQRGGDVINLTRLLYDANGVSEDFELPQGVAAPRPVSECHPNCSGLERISGFGVFQKQYIEDASFLKLREVSLSYRIPDRLRGRLWSRVDDARISLSGRNLITWTNYSGLDPEVSNFGSQQIGRGFDVAPYPPSRSIWLSVNLDF